MCTSPMPPRHERLHLMPRHLFTRLVLLLLAVLALSTMIGLVLLRIAMHDVTVLHTARALEAQLVAADVLFAQSDRADAQMRLHRLGLEHRPDPPESSPRVLPFLHDVETELARRLPSRNLSLIASPQPMLWVAAERTGDGWIGIPLLPLRGLLTWSLLLSLLVALLLVFGAAAWYAGTLVRPLRLLAAAAPGLAAGEPAPALPRHAATEIGELAAALDRAAADTRDAARERQLLLAGISHDMRTPLARLALALELLNGDDATIREGMAADVAELDTIIGQFIAYVRDGRDEPEQTADIGGLLDDALAAQERAGRSWQRVGEHSLMLYARPLALRRALDNLLENAARHGAAPFEVVLRKTAHGASILVTDRGPGVSADVLKDLARPFYQADAARGGIGSGLGLATAARIAAWHGGSLDLRNRRDGGFEAELRIAQGRA